MIRLTAALLLCLSVVCAKADTLTLTVDSLFALIDDCSRAVKIKSLAADYATQGVSVAKSQRLPTLNADLSIGYLGNGYLTDRNFSNGMGIKNPHFTDNFALEAMQVVYSGGAISTGIKLAELGSKMAELNLEATRQDTRFVMLGQLIDLHRLYNQANTLRQNTDLAKQVLEDTRARYEEGVALLSDITRYELQVENLRLQTERNKEAISVTNYRMANALRFNPEVTKFYPALSLLDSASVVLPETEWQQLAHGNNTGIQRAALGREISDAELRLTQSERLPKVGLFAYGHFDGPVTIEVPVLDKNFMYWGFGVNVSYNISSLFKTNKKEKQAKINQFETAEAYDIAIENVENNVQAAYQRYLTAKTELATCEKSLQLALQNYQIVNDRYINGIALVTDMVDAANVRLAAELDLDNARHQLLFCFYQLQYTANIL